MSSLILYRFASEAYRHQPDEPFTLSSGEKSADYVDSRRALSNPNLLRDVGKLFYEQLYSDTVAVGGMTQGADPIAVATSLTGNQHFQRAQVSWFSVRKVAKEHGVRGRIVGSIDPFDKVAVVDDVVTTGGSVIEAIRVLREEGHVIQQVMVLLDREVGGMEAIQRVLDEVPLKSKLVQARAFFTMTQLKKTLLSQQT